MQHGAEGRPHLPAVQERLGLPHPGADAVVDLVPVHLVDTPRVGGLGGDLLVGEADLDRQQPEPGHSTLPRLDLIVDDLGEHLVAAADAQDRAPGGAAGSDRLVQTVLAEPGQVVHGRP